MGKRIPAVLIAVVGIVLMAYPWISNWLYDQAADAVISSYEANLSSVSSPDLYQYWADAREYNEDLLNADVVLADPFTYENVSLADGLDYSSLLNVSGTGVMCFVEIPKIDVYLPVYHNTSEESLARGAGHVEGTALPVGTVGGRPILSAHTGVNSAKMFSDLTQLTEGDLFFLHVMDAVFAYEIVETAVIEPDDVSTIREEAGRDLVSLMTCTPYGVNSHRLIVTGERTAYTPETVEEAESQSMEEDTEWMRAYKRALCIGICIIAAFFAAVLLIRAFLRSEKTKFLRRK
ncbi:MAG: class C sortase [Clostridiales bacterium]|nr:class C sortase [Clostridiales bacterium]